MARPIDWTLNSSRVPKGTPAVYLTVSVVNAFNGPGALTVWRNGVARPSSSTLTWGAGSGTGSTSTICGLDANAVIQVAVSASTSIDVVIVVVGCFR